MPDRPAVPPSEETAYDRKQALADALRQYPSWGDAYLAEKERADRLASVANDAWGTLLAYWTDIPQSEVQRLVARFETVCGDVQ